MSFLRYRLMVEASAPNTYTSDELDRWGSAFTSSRSGCSGRTASCRGHDPQLDHAGRRHHRDQPTGVRYREEMMRVDYANMLPPAMIDIPVYCPLVVA